MKTINIFGDCYNENPTKVREACRAIIVKDDNILISYEEKTNQLMLPGGGIELGENHKQCLIREIEEETGYVVELKEKVITINEYYDDILWINYYYTCNIVGLGSIKLSQVEIQEGMIAKWFNLNECLNIFESFKHEPSCGTGGFQHGLYKREYNALKEYMMSRL